MSFHQAAQPVTETDLLPAVELSPLGPDPESVFAPGTALGPNLLEGFGKAPKHARDSSRVGWTRLAFILVMNCARHWVAAVLDARSPQFAV